MESEMVTIQVLAGTASSGKLVYEELPAYQTGENAWILCASPGLTLNLAKGDIVEIVDISKPARVLQRGGNFCIQIYSDGLPDGELELLVKDVENKLYGSFDGQSGGNLSFSAPATAGLNAINQVFNAFRVRTNIQWYFGNIYKNFEDENDETLLDWWKVEEQALTSPKKPSTP